MPCAAWAWHSRSPEWKHSVQLRQPWPEKSIDEPVNELAVLLLVTHYSHLGSFQNISMQPFILDQLNQKLLLFGGRALEDQHFKNKLSGWLLLGHQNAEPLVQKILHSRMRALKCTTKYLFRKSEAYFVLWCSSNRRFFFLNVSITLYYFHHWCFLAVLIHFSISLPQLAFHCLILITCLANILESFWLFPSPCSWFHYILNWDCRATGGTFILNSLIT